MTRNKRPLTNKRPIKNPKSAFLTKKTKIFSINLVILPKYPKLSILTLPIDFLIEGTTFYGDLSYGDLNRTA
ncbi:MAG: hypothetical protein PHQ35_05965 [Phycisphaerae bacterium]|nr:hypothetical protein [Phycisphaerae bacterium]